MEPPDDALIFPKWPFLAGDALLLAVAGYIAYAAGSPLPAAAIYAISGCVGFGALLAVLPFIVDYNRRQDALLSERQNALEALVRTTSSAVEQASITAGGLHEIAELAQKNLRLADQLPHKLQERINEFNRMQDEALAAELESLQQEVNSLRASEAEKLDSAADRVQRATSDLARIEEIFRQHARNLPAAGAAADSQRQDAAATSAPPASVPPKAPASPSSAGRSPVSASDSARRPTVTEPVPPPSTGPENGNPPPTGEVGGEPPGAAPPPPPATPAPSPARKAGGRRRSTDTTPPRFADGLLNDNAPVESGRPVIPEDVIEEEARAGGTADESTQLSPDEANPEPARSSDGVTRLIATAYIGIGNKLYIRGEGPGLSWDRGVPLQFVSIGKWRWETADASGPVVAKLFKNDQIECTTLGGIHLQPGHQREVTASF